MTESTKYEIYDRITNDRFMYFTVGVFIEKALTILCSYISKVGRIYDLAIKSLSVSTGNWIRLIQKCWRIDLDTVATK